MISVSTAKELVQQHCKPLPPVAVPLNCAGGLCLAEDIFSPIDMPSFNQSAMDGYAICFADIELGKPLPVIGESQAGSTSLPPLSRGTAMRIFTGAPVPAGADTVVMQEHVERIGNDIYLNTTKLIRGSNVRLLGSEINKNDLALPNGTMLSAGAIGYLAGLGKTEVLASPTPKVTIIVTGKELQKPGLPLQFGQVYESNSITLTTALQHYQIHKINIQCIDDDIDLLESAINAALNSSDLILITGGVSVGDYDLVLPAVKQCGVETIFHKIKQKPGKPLFFGKKEDKVVFGLPGNPASVLSCFYHYVLVALQQLCNRPYPYLQKATLTIDADYTKPAGLTHFLKGSYIGANASPLNAQESFRLSSFALANCLIEIPEETTHIKAGEKVSVYLIP
jgi:molybdopterin molybdotransferase